MKLAKRSVLWLFFCFPLVLNVGCGGSVAPGVADGPDEPATELSEDEVANEEAYNRELQRSQE